MPGSFRYIAFGLFLCAIGLLPLGTNSFALEKQDNGALTHYIMGVFYEDLGDIDKAISEYRRALDSDNAASIHLGLASIYVKKGSLEQAINELGICIKLDPESIEPHAILAILYASLNKTNLAEQEYEAALKNASKLEPKNAEIYKELGLLYLKQDKFNDAEIVFKCALTLNPNDFESHFYLGAIYDKLNNGALSEKELSKAIEIKPDFDIALNYLGYIYAQQNRNLPRAEDLIIRALKADPNNAAYIDSLGWVYFKRGKIKEALKKIEKADTLIEDPEVSDHLGEIYLKMGDVKKARASWEKSLKLDPQQKLVKEKLDKLNKLK
jgi:Tfp pilus assembly protein PilF